MRDALRLFAHLVDACDDCNLQFSISKRHNLYDILYIFFHIYNTEYLFSSTVIFCEILWTMISFLIFRGNDCTNNFSYSNIPMSHKCDSNGIRWRSRMECLIRKYRFNFEFNLLQMTSNDKLYHRMAVFPCAPILHLLQRLQTLVDLRYILQQMIQILILDVSWWWRMQ